MKIHHHALVVVICFGIILFWITSYEPSVVLHPYMRAMTFILFGVGG